jgi:hypothetical protein
MGYCKAVAFPSGPLRPLRLCGEVPVYKFTPMIRFSLRSNLGVLRIVVFQKFYRKGANAKYRKVFLNFIDQVSEAAATKKISYIEYQSINPKLYGNEH